LHIGRFQNNPKLKIRKTNAKIELLELSFFVKTHQLWS
jgi:hypothetical protein